MRPTFTILSLFLSCFLIFNSGVLQAESVVDTSEQSPAILFSLEECESYSYNGTNIDYSEFTAEMTVNPNCSSLGLVTANLYRSNPSVNGHSCTPGVNNSIAMCVGSDPMCSYTPGSDRAVKFDVLVMPGPSGTGSISNLSFYEKGPENFEWIDGPSGFNDPPTLYAVRVLVNGNVVFEQFDIPTTTDWTLESFDFDNNPAFEVDEPTEFNFELVSYCLSGNGAMLSAWDLDEIKISGGCPAIEGGTITTTDETTVCADDGDPDLINTSLTGEAGEFSAWIITDSMGQILMLPIQPPFDFEGAGAGICLIWHISYSGSLTGVGVGNNISGLVGCYDLSNSIEVIRNTGADCEEACIAEGGDLEGGPFEFCVGDSIPDTIAVGMVTLTGAAGDSMQWVVTDTTGMILSLPDNLQDLDFDGAGVGVCLIWHLSYQDSMSELLPDNNIFIDLAGCYDLSDSVVVNRIDCTIPCIAEGGDLEGGPFTFCVGDSIPDTIPDGMITLTGAVGDTMQWVITDSVGVILSLPDSIEAVDFDGGGVGVCLIWNISYQDSVSGLAMGSNVLTDLDGCYELSDSVVVNRINCTMPCDAEGGTLSGGPFTFCVGDSIPDTIPAGMITLTGAAGDTMQWVVTDTSGMILSLPDSIEAVDFDGAGVGVCLIWNISYQDSISGLEAGNNLMTDITGCFDVSNSVTVNRVDCPPACDAEGGDLAGGPFTFCVGDSIPDTISSSELTLSGAVGDTMQWVVTDTSGMILSLPDSIEAVDFDGAGVGICLIWNISYQDSISGLEAGNNLMTDITGCFDVSNSVTVNRVDCPPACDAEGGDLAGGPFTFCVGDSIPDTISSSELTLSGAAGDSMQWVVTDTTGMILSLPDSIEAVDFDGAGVGVCLIWNISYQDSISGLEVGNNIMTDITGCFDLSNSVTVIREDCTPVCDAEGGDLAGGPFTFCVGDGMPDTIASGDLTLTGAVGDSMQLVVTDSLGMILMLPDNIEDVDFDGAGVGVCFIYNVSYDATMSGLMVGNDLFNDLGGCYDISNSVMVERVACPTGAIVLNELNMEDYVEVKNVGSTTIDISGYFLCQFPAYESFQDLTLVCGDMVLDPGEIATFMAHVDIDPLDGEMGIYWGPTFHDPAFIVDYVEWGSTGHMRSTIAAAAGIWTAGDFVPAWNANIEYDGSGDSSGDWSEDAFTLCQENNVTGGIALNEINIGDFVEVKNTGSTTIDISNYFLCQFPDYETFQNLTILSCGDLVLEPGEIAAFIPHVDIDQTDGELGIYWGPMFDDPDFIVDYVEWGSSGHMRSSVAEAAGIWTAGDFVPAFAVNIAYDGDGDSSTDWSEAVPSICDENNFTDEPGTDKLSFDIYPNPANEFINLRLNSSQENILRLQIFDSYGRLIDNREVILEKNVDPLQIDINNYQTGMYYIKLIDRFHTEVRTFFRP